MGGSSWGIPSRHHASPTHRIHGAGIYANIGDILMGSMLPYIAAPWILWAILRSWSKYLMTGGFGAP